MDNTIRAEINQIIQTLPDNQLKPILEYLKQVEKTTSEQVTTAHIIKKILEEDKELLKRLAQ